MIILLIPDLLEPLIFFYSFLDLFKLIFSPCRQYFIHEIETFTVKNWLCFPLIVHLRLSSDVLHKLLNTRSKPLLYTL